MPHDLISRLLEKDSFFWIYRRPLLDFYRFLHPLPNTYFLQLPSLRSVFSIYSVWLGKKPKVNCCEVFAVQNHNVCPSSFLEFHKKRPPLLQKWDRFGMIEVESVYTCRTNGCKLWGHGIFRLTSCLRKKSGTFDCSNHTRPFLLTVAWPILDPLPFVL